MYLTATPRWSRARTPARLPIHAAQNASEISHARAEAERTAERRAQQRVVNARHRDKVEETYRVQFAAAVVAWLDFAPEHNGVAEGIAHAAAERAVAVGSGRVGRTKVLPLEERAALAARATIRHGFTDYDDRLAGLDPFEVEVDDFEYRTIKQTAHDAVDDLLCAHRRPPARA